MLIVIDSAILRSFRWRRWRKNNRLIWRSRRR